MQKVNSAMTEFKLWMTSDHWAAVRDILHASENCKVLSPKDCTWLSNGISQFCIYKIRWIKQGSTFPSLIYCRWCTLRSCGLSVPWQPHHYQGTLSLLPSLNCVQCCSQISSPTSQISTPFQKPNFSKFQAAYWFHYATVTLLKMLKDLYGTDLFLVLL